MNGISKTTLSGIAGFVILAAVLAMWVLGKVSAVEAAGAIATFATGALSLGLIAAKDDSAPDAQVNVTQVGDEIRLEATAQDAPDIGKKGVR